MNTSTANGMCAAINEMMFAPCSDTSRNTQNARRAASQK
jgi:hypothetical protein